MFQLLAAEMKQPPPEEDQLDMITRSCNSSIAIMLVFQPINNFRDLYRARLKVEHTI